MREAVYQFRLGTYLASHALAVQAYSWAEQNYQKRLEGQGRHLASEILRRIEKNEKS